MDVLFAAEGLMPAVGGAERFVVEALAAIRERHLVHTIYLAPERRPERYWEWRRLRREEVGRRVEQALSERGADVVVTQLHSAPAVIATATAAGVPSVLLLPSYESLCQLAFDAGSECHPETRCRGCPALEALPASERAELARSRTSTRRRWLRLRRSWLRADRRRRVLRLVSPASRGGEPGRCSAPRC